MKTEKIGDEMYDVGVKCTYTVQKRLAGIYSVKMLFSNTGVLRLKAVRVSKWENN